MAYRLLMDLRWNVCRTDELCKRSRYNCDMLMCGVCQCASVQVGAEGLDFGRCGLNRINANASKISIVMMCDACHDSINNVAQVGAEGLDFGR